jgi:hypothetical protein
LTALWSKCLVCLAALLVLSACSDRRPDNRPSATTLDSDDSAAPRPIEPAQVEGRAPTRKDLRGAWRPVSLFGVKETRTAIHGTPLDLRFGRQAEGWGWIAYDGCNWTSAFARIDKTGRFKSVSEPASTMRGCSGSKKKRPRNVEAVQGAKRIELRGPLLVLLDPRNEVTGEYVRS